MTIRGFGGTLPNRKIASLRESLASLHDLVDVALGRAPYRYQDTERLVGAGLQLGEGVRVHPWVYIDSSRPWLIRIGANTGLSPHCKILTHDDSMKIQTGLTRIGPVEIGERVFIGNGAIILPGSRIGNDSVIGAGAVVSGEIPPGSVAAGQPATVVTTVERYMAWKRQALTDAPFWPREGWVHGMSVTRKRKALQREALAGGREGLTENTIDTVSPWSSSSLAALDGASRSEPLATEPRDG
jgi:maltose O-acetyltransferase